MYVSQRHTCTIETPLPIQRDRARKRGTEGEREIETWTKRKIDRESEMATKERKRKNLQDTAGYRERVCMTLEEYRERLRETKSNSSTGRKITGKGAEQRYQRERKTMRLCL